MKLVRFGPAGREQPGIIDATGTLRDLSAHVGDWAGSALDPAQLASLADLDIGSLPAVAGSPRLGACASGVGKIVCAGINYRSLTKYPGVSMPQTPVIFLKAASALCGADDPLELPPGALHVDWEVELAVIIGRGGRRIRTKDAWQHVAGFAVFNDISERAWQFGEGQDLLGQHNGGQWGKGKNHDGFASLGPWLVTPDEVPQLSRLQLWLDVDGVRMQSAQVSDMHFDIPCLLADISCYMRLEPGDVVATGTPPGSAFLRGSDARYLRHGQQVRAGIDGLGVQNRRVVSTSS